MKTKISISIEEETLRQIEEFAKQNTFRNKSHVIEFAVQKLAEGVISHINSTWSLYEPLYRKG